LGKGGILEKTGAELSLASASPLNVKDALSALLRRRWVILGTFVPIFAAVALYTLRQPKVYEASTSMIIEVAAPHILDGQVQDVSDSATNGYWWSREYTETQFKVITSRAVATRVVEKLGLDRDPGFLGVEGIADQRRREELMRHMDAAALLQSKISVIPVKDSRIARIIVEDSSPQRAALLANEVADAYIAENLALRLKTSESANRWLEERLAELEQKSKHSEIAVYDFKKDADMLTTSLEDRASMVSSRLNSYNSALTDARTRIAGELARVEAIKRLRSSVDNAKTPEWSAVLSSAPETALVSQLRVRYVTERNDCSALTERYLSDHPKMVACQDRLKSARADLLAELSNIVRTAEAEQFEAVARERNLRELFDAAKAEAFEVNKKQIEFDRLKREADNNQRLYDMVLKRLKDTELSGMLRTSNARILDSARPSLIPVHPKVQTSLLLGFLLALVGSIGLAVVLEKLDNTVKSQADVEERIGLPFLGFVPRLPQTNRKTSDGEDLFVYRNPKSSVAEACRAIRTNLLFMTPDRPLRTMLVTSSGPREGKTTTVINTGITMAQSGSRVLLVDTDMRRPRLHKTFGVANELGVSSAIVGEATLAQVTKSTEVPNLFVVPCGPIPPNPAELFHAKAFKDFIDAAVGSFDRVIFDSPPVNAVADPAVLSTQVDGVLMVLRGSETPRALAQRAVRTLRGVNAHVLGAILNDVDLGSSRYGYYYAAYRRYGYDDAKDTA
jgi:polysaccharide biosynthesis transport protein